MKLTKFLLPAILAVTVSGAYAAQPKKAVCADCGTVTAIKVVMIASALPGEGKTLTATNLALTLSESYQRDVLLIGHALLQRLWLIVQGTEDRTHAATRAPS